jgi:hypothetical protein
MDLGVNAILQTAGKTMSSDQVGSVLFCLGSCTMKQGCHQSFQSYVAKKLQELGFQIIYRDEYLTSQMFPGSGSKTEFAGANKMRIKYCPDNQVYIHRDLMAGENMADIAAYEIKGLGRPVYLMRPKQQGSSQSA